ALLADLPAPWFVWLHYTDPHAPYEPPDSTPLRPWELTPSAPMSVAERAAPGFQRTNPWFVEAFRRFPDTATVAGRYVGEVQAMDAALGALRDGLTAAGHRDDTVWIVTADHGENMGEHNLFFHHGGLYAASVHVPLLVAIPGAAPRALPASVSSVDIAPTVLELAGVPPWPGMRGHSLVAYGRGAAAAPASYAFSEHMLGQLASVRGPEGTLIVHRRRSRQFPSYPMTPGTEELFGADDLREARPLPARGAAVTRLRQALAAFLAAPTPDWQARPAPPSNHESLRSLGYTE
ncbi:MAG TPA: sulfatase-like hydrolase/transferase, partial [Myxococcota bacterium]|nr:sulfatase-like hydrolase/transferase [Myxococcota bacterium]